MTDLITIITSITALIVAISTFFKNLIEVKKNLLPKKIRKQSELSLIIMDILENAKEEFRADRVQIYDFHNGEHYANGRSALKVSCTYESVRVGVTPHQNDLQSIPLSCIAKFHNTLLNQNFLYVKDLEDIKNTMPATYQLKSSQQIQSFFDIILSNKNGDPIGFLGIQYNTKDIVLTEEEQHEILKLKLEIEDKLEKMNVK